LKQFVKISGLQDADAADKIDELERYTYLFDMNAQQLDHMFVSDSVAKKIKYEHLHLNTWPEFAAQVSDHDPSVARVDVCA
jgi:predicted extracellular nuclease